MITAVCVIDVAIDVIIRYSAIKKHSRIHTDIIVFTERGWGRWMEVARLILSCCTATATAAAAVTECVWVIVCCVIDDAAALIG